MAATTKHVPIPSDNEEETLSNNANPSDPPTTLETAQSLDPKPKRKLTKIACISLIVILVVIVLTIVIVVIYIKTTQSVTTGACDCDRFDTDSNRIPSEVCGIDVRFNSSATNPYQCKAQCESGFDEEDWIAVYFVQDSASKSSCYCSIYNDTSKSSCFNSNNVDVRMWEYNCCVDGRPYWIQSTELQSDVKYIDCEEYVYYDDTEWKAFVQNTNYTDFSGNIDMISKWKKQAISEYTSIATFAKFSLQLMSIGAPLWLIELSNKASLDEIKHAHISFDIVNMYLGGEQCMVSSIFPQHVIDINADWNEISADTAIGGCVGETVSAFKMVQDAHYNNVIDEYVYEMAMDEIRHAALAWITVKWMIDNASNDVNMEVTSKEWWNKVVLKSKRTGVVYDDIIPSILDKMWIDCENYHELYHLIIEELQIYLNTASCII